jgi:hypothetical protein
MVKMFEKQFRRKNLFWLKSVRFPFGDFKTRKINNYIYRGIGY